MVMESMQSLPVHSISLTVSLALGGMWLMFNCTWVLITFEILQHQVKIYFQYSAVLRGPITVSSITDSLSSIYPFMNVSSLNKKSLSFRESSKCSHVESLLVLTYEWWVEIKLGKRKEEPSKWWVHQNYFNVEEYIRDKGQRGGCMARVNRLSGEHSRWCYRDRAGPYCAKAY